MDDGSDIRDGTSTNGRENVGVRVICSPPSDICVGDSVLVVGVSSCFPVGDGLARRILTRATTDVRPAVGPYIIRQPEDFSACSGSVAVFSILAGHAVRYQWQLAPPFGDWLDVPGATASSFTTSILSRENSGSRYRCVVFGPGDTGSVTSDEALLTVGSPGGWQPDFGVPGANGYARTLADFDGNLYVAGAFSQIGGVSANRIARWNGTTWVPLGSGMNHNVYGMITWDDGAGLALYAAGAFTESGGVTTNRIGKWNGTHWTPLGEGINPELSYPNSDTCWAIGMCAFNDGSGPALFVGGKFTRVGNIDAFNFAKWDGKEWSAIPESQFDDDVYDMIVWNDGSGPALYIGGRFTTANGQTCNRIVKWDGHTWTPLGSGLSGGRGPAGDCIVIDMAIWDDGTGEALYVAGTFSEAGGLSVNGLAKWNGTAWSTVGNGLGTKSGYALELYDDGLGGGSALFVGGDFTISDGAPANRLAKWNGISWSAVESVAVDGLVRCLKTYDVGFDDGPSLYAVGSFTLTGGSIGNRVARRARGFTPWIIQQPINLSVSVGEDIVFHAEAELSHHAPVRYQWLKDGISLNDNGRISGSRTGNLAIRSVNQDDAGVYRIECTGGCGQTVSLPTRLTIRL